MSVIQTRIDKVNELKDAVKGHCMCLHFTETAAYYLVQYPEGFFPDGVRAETGTNKAQSLRRILNAMERHWKDSYPCAS